MNKHLFFLLSLFSVLLYRAQAPAGYYSSAAGLTGAALKTQLKTIISTGHIDHGYNSLLGAYQNTDRDYFYENDGTILDIYSENPAGTDPYTFGYGQNVCGNYSSEGDCYNREHVVPQSLFNSGAPMVSDIHHIRPTDGKVNGMRSNFPFGKVGTATYTSQNGSKLGNSISAGYSGIVFEPIDNFKGDIARMIFYFVTRYESQLSGFNTGNMLGGSAYPGLQTWELNQLLAWNAADPVSAEEIARNNASYIYQGNRNPFIDNSAYATLIWGSTTSDTTAPTAPTNLAANNTTANSTQLSWTAATDNIGVAGYQIFKDGVLYTTVTGTTATVSGLSPATTYQFFVKAIDAAGNVSAASNTVTVTTLTGGGTNPGTSCGTEDFTNIPAASSSYTTVTWTNNNITWTATNARTDQTLNGKAICFRTTLTSSTITGNIGSITMTTKLPFTDNPGNITVKINGISVGTIPYSATATTTTLPIPNGTANGSYIIQLSIADNSRVIVDDLNWTCDAMATSETSASENAVTVAPSVVKSGEQLIFTAKDLAKIEFVKLFAADGTLVETFGQPFKKGNTLKIGNLPAGIYVLRTDSFTKKIIVK